MEIDMSKEWKASWSIIIGLLTFTPAVLYALGFHVMPEAFFCANIWAFGIGIIAAELSRGD